MGHWSTYRRRGSSPSFRDGLSLPATPLLTIPGDIISITAPDGNTGGIAELWTAITEFGTYDIDDFKPWTTVVNFGARTIYSGSWIKTMNVADGVHRKGRSPFSNALLA